jgi:hypothetical protein
MRREGPHRQAGLKMALKADTRPMCLACNGERRFISAEPVRRGYEISNYECPRCKTIMRLAQKTSQRRQYEDD